MVSYCCTCAAPLSVASPASPAAAVHRQLPCCGRFVCGHCLTKNARFATYCPYCQIATAPPPSPMSKEREASAQDLPLPQGLKAPPPYRRFGAAAPELEDDEAPPPYAALAAPAAKNSPQSTPEALSEKPGDAAPIIHYLDHDRDSIASLSLRYNIPADLLRRTNRLSSDHLLLARRVVQIPAASALSSSSPSSSSSFSSPAVSLSPMPVEGEGEARRKAAIRRFMVACKVADYDLAVLYLEQTAVDWLGGGADGDEGVHNGKIYDLGAAVMAFEADEQWEKAHPMEAVARKKQKQKQAERSRW